MKIIYANESPNEDPCQSIFLAGPSPQSKEHYNWRPEALEILKKIEFDGSVFVPISRDGNWLPNYNAKVEWELTHLDMASVIVFWIPRDLETRPGFRTNVKYGMYLKSGKIILGFPENTPKMKYLAHLADIHNISIYHTLEKTLNNALQKLRSIS